MATVAVCSAVYLGDVAPFLAVGRQLAQRGHRVVAVVPEGFRSAVEGEGFELRPYGLDCSPAGMHADPRHTRLMRHPTVNVTRLGAYWVDKAFADDPAAAERSLRDGFDGVDVVLTHPTFGMASIPVARSMGIPTVAGQLFPMMIPTASWTPPMGSRSLRLPAPLSRATWWGLRRMTGLAMRDGATNAMRRRLGQPPVRGAAGFTWLEADRTVVLASRRYFGEVPDDWPPVHWCGFAEWRGPGDQGLAPDVLEHLTAGSTPVVVTLGTSAATGAAATFARIRRDLDEAGLRSVLLTGETVDVGALAAEPGVVPFAPLPAVLPHCSAAVVSGALGGLAAALRAGRPVVVHPQLFDQMWHGRRVEQLGVGILARRPSQVARAVVEIVSDPGYAARAAALATELQQEDGVSACADHVEGMIT